MEHCLVVSCPEDKKILLNLLNTKDVIIKDIESPIKRMNISDLMNGMSRVQSFIRKMKLCSENFTPDAMWRRNNNGIKKTDLGLFHSIFLWPNMMAGDSQRMQRSKARNWYYNEDNPYTAKFAIMDITVTKILNGEVFLPPECIGQPLVLLNHSRVKLFLSGKKRNKYRLKKLKLKRKKPKTKPKKPKTKPKKPKTKKRSMPEYWIAYWRKVEEEEKEKRCTSLK